MTFPMPVLIDVQSAKYAADGKIDLAITVTNHRGNKQPETIPYTWDPSEEMLPDGRVYSLGLEVASWLLSNPKFEIEPYVESEPPPSRDLIAEIDALTTKLARYEKTEAALIEKGVLSADDVKIAAGVKR